MSQIIPNVGVIMAHILHYLVKEMLVLNLGGAGIILVSKGRVLLEHLLAAIHVRNDLLGLENGNGPLAHIKIHRWLGCADEGVTLASPLIGVAGPSNGIVE